MKKIYKESYFNRRNWILENFDKLNLNLNETLFILYIDFCKEQRKIITYESLMNKMHLDLKEIDQIIADLINKKYLTLTTNSKGLVFDFDNVFEFDPNKFNNVTSTNIFDKLEDLFSRPLSSSELVKISELLNIYDEDSFIEALRIAEANNKLKLSYIEGVLKNEKKN